MAEPILKLPAAGVEVTESRTSYSWFDEDGILCVINKKAPPTTMDENMEQIRKFYELAQGRKFCMLADTTNSTPSDKETRKLAAEELPKMVKAIALLSQSPMGRMIANLFFSVMKQPYPVKMFGDEKEAKDWLKQYL